MDRLKQWIDSITSPRLELRERLYRLMVTFGLLVLFVVFLTCVLLRDRIEVIILIGLCWLLFFGVSVYYIQKRKVGMAIQWVATVLSVVVLPVTFFLRGGLNGATPIWFVFCFAYVSLMMDPAARWAYYILNGIIIALCYTLAYLHPEWIIKRRMALAYVDSFGAVILLSFLICLMIIYQHIALKEQIALANEQKAEIMELNRMQNGFFSSMSHEIRTPINTIIGLNEMTLRDKDISDEVAENSMNIMGASKILLALINDILDMSKIESGKMTIVPSEYDVGDLLSDIVNMIWSRAVEKRLKLHVDVDEELPAKLYGDEVRIKQVLINVLNNAVKYTEQGQIVFGIKCASKDDETARIVFTVEDTGKGIRAESIPYLFVAFHRDDEQNNKHIEGTGLGLSIVKQLVELMDGNISVDSVYGSGSKFTISLDQGICNDEKIGSHDFEQRRRLDSRKQYVRSFEAEEAKILVVDDNEVNLLVVEKLLRDTKVGVETAGSGAECLSKTLTTQYDLIFMDHLMPEMDGIECLHALRHQSGGLNINTPVVALTANAGSDLISMYSREGFDDTLLKPVNGESLEKEVLKFLNPDIVSATYGELESADEEGIVRSYVHKRPIRITTESVCDLPEEVIKKDHIGVIPFSIHTGGGDFLEGVEIEADAALNYLEYENKEVRIMEPEVGDYVRFFTEQLKSSQHIIHIAQGSGTSGAYFKAMAASRTLDSVTVIDSRSISSGLGLLVMKAAGMTADHATVEEIVNEIEASKPGIHMGFILDDTRYLKRSGRVPQRVTMMCEAFMLHPAVSMSKEGMGLQKLYPGRRNKVWKRYISDRLKESDRIDKGIVFIAYAGLERAELDYIEMLIKQHVSFNEVICQKVSSSSSTIFGPGTFGLIFADKE